jgi:hypothetical protein
MYVTSVCFKCFSYFKRMMQVFYLDVAYVTLVVHVCCKYMFQMFQLFKTYVVSVLFGCFSAHTQMLQAYVVNVSSVSDVCCSKCFMLQVFHQQMWQGVAGRRDPLGRSGPHVCVGSEAGAAVSADHKAISMGMVTGVEDEATSIGRH